MKRATAAAADRFRADNRRFPATAYEESSLLWRGTEWRQPDPSERALLHGMPPAMVEAIHGHGGDEKTTAARNSAIGNGFHVPSLMLALVILFQMLPQGQATIRALPDPREKQLVDNVRNTAFDDYLVDRFPGLLSAAALVKDMQQQLPMITTSEHWSRVEHNLGEINLNRLQRYWVYLKMHGHTAAEAGPDWASQRQRALAQAALGSQRAAGDSKKGLDHMFEPGLGKESHIQRATAAPNPFEVKQPVDLDLAFAAEALAIFGPGVAAWRAQEKEGLSKAFAALTPLRCKLDPMRSETARAVAPSRDVAGLALITALLRWPDRTQAQGYLEGFQVIGEIPSSRVFRQVHPEAPVDLEDTFFGQAAVDEIQQLLDSPPPKDAAEIYQLTLEEIEKNFTQPLRSAEELDKIFGVGGWRPIHRFLVRQGEKSRLIDDGRRGAECPRHPRGDDLYHRHRYGPSDRKAGGREGALPPSCPRSTRLATVAAWYGRPAGRIPWLPAARLPAVRGCSSIGPPSSGGGPLA